MVKKYWGFTVIANFIFLGGCAMTPLSPEQHQSFARDYSLINICAQKGYMSTDLAANGINILQKNMSRYSNINNQLMHSYIHNYQQIANQVSPELCNQTAVSIQTTLIQRRQQQESIAQFNQSMKEISESFKQNTPKMTNCFNNGYGMTSCTTY